MEVRYETDTRRFICDCTFYEKDVPKTAKFRWNPTDKVWWTDDVLKAARLRDLADRHAASVIDKAVAAKDKAVAASAATTSDEIIPVPEGLEYRPFQKAGIAAAGQRNVLIGDEMGLGKTIQAIGIINNDKSIRKALIIVPASLRLNWEKELKKWLVNKDLTIGIAKGSNVPDTDIVIINYDILNRHSDLIRSIEWDLLVADESHKLKNGKAQRTKAVVGRWHKDPEKNIVPVNAKRKVFLTGTPILNRPIELWTTLHYLDPENWKSFWGFAKRYCGAIQTKYGWDLNGASNLDELQIKLRETVLVRRLKADVLAELPSKTRQVIELPQNGTAAAVKNEQKVLAKLNAVADKLEALKSVEPNDFEEAVRQLKTCTIEFEEISRVRHETAVAKIPAAVNFINDILEDKPNYKLVVFAHHHDVVHGLKDGIGADKCVTLIGTDSDKARDKAVESFQNDPAVQVFIGTIGAAGVGLTLTAGSHVIFVELDWVPGNVTQAEDRVHRIGQNEAVLIQHLVVADTIDAKIAHTIISKQGTITKAVDMKKDAKSMTEDYINKNKALVDAAKKKAGRKIKKVEKKAMRRAELREKVDTDKVELIHNGLYLLSTVCDGALSEDGQGFNKFDSNFGKSLASQNPLWWSEKQVKAAAKLIIKYRGQLPDEVIEAGYEVKDLLK